MAQEFASVSLGHVLEGNTVCDYDPEEIERQISIRTAMITTEYDSYHFNMMDTPGYADFLSDAQAALRVSDSAVVVVEAQKPSAKIPAVEQTYAAGAAIGAVALLLWFLSRASW